MAKTSRQSKIGLPMIGGAVMALLGILCLGGAGAAFYKLNDPMVVRSGDMGDFYNHLTIALAVPGLLLITGAVAFFIITLLLVVAKKPGNSNGA